MIKRCPITYKNISKGFYSEEGLRLLSRSLKKLSPLSLSAEGLRQKGLENATKMSIQGVQHKLSAVLKIKEGSFKFVDQGGKYILKPQNPDYQQLPENEDLTMRLAKAVGIEVPFSCLLWSADESLTYCIKRFDRYGQNKKLAVEDFAQLTGSSRETKYSSSMEKVAEVIENFCTFPEIEKLKLFKLTIFNFLIGNEDMHLKNFSLLVENEIIRLSPAYDLLNTTIALSGATEELALPLRGKKRNLTKNILIEYFGLERLGLQSVVVDSELEEFRQQFPLWNELINKSFLKDSLKEKYLVLLEKRIDKLF